MPATRVSGHYRRGTGWVSSYTQNRSGRQRVADAGVGLAEAALLLTAQVIGLLTTLLTLICLTALAVFGALLGVDLYKRRPRRGRRRSIRHRNRRDHGHRQRPTGPPGPPARRQHEPGLLETPAPFGDRNALYRRDGNQLRRVR